jgi:hypothetical protein
MAVLDLNLNVTELELDGRHRYRSNYALRKNIKDPKRTSGFDPAQFLPPQSISNVH